MKAIALFFMLIPFVSMGQIQDPVELTRFKIIVEQSPEGITLHAQEGCAWIDLSFNLRNYQSQTIDEYGMTEHGEVSSVKDNELADFLFTITKTDNGILIKGIEGTAWKELSFSLTEDERKAIDQNGMTDLE